MVFLMVKPCSCWSGKNPNHFNIYFMNLDQQILGNSIRSYLFILAVLLATFIFKRFISRFFASLIYTWVDKKNHSELRKSHVHRLIVPIEQFLLFFVAAIAIYKLQFPAFWNVQIFKFTLEYSQFFKSEVYVTSIIPLPLFENFS
jgi:hypothetical protein